MGLLFWLVSFPLQANVLLASGAFSEASDLKATPAMDWLAFGDLRGHFETCGCDPLTDLGGVARLATLVQRERAKRPDLYLFSLGNLLSKNPHPIGARYLFKAFEALKPRVALVASKELLHRATYPITAEPYVLSNASSALESAPSAVQRLQNGWYVLGYTSPQGSFSPLVEKLSSSLWEKWAKLAPTPPRLLLFSGTSEELEAIVATSFFTEIIAGSMAAADVAPGAQERQEPQRLEHVFAKASVWSVPLGGTGVLRGGALLYEEAAGVQQLLKSRSSKTTRPFLSSSDTSLNLSFPSKKGDLLRITWLQRSYEAGSPLKTLTEVYTKDMAAAFRERAASRRSALSHTPYVGSAACAGCHPGAYKVWQASSHRVALETLKKVGKAEDEACVSCHVVGGDQKGGFVSEVHSPHLAGVQCENCHGPRRDHVMRPVAAEDAKKNQQAARQVCVKCHHPPHSGAFDFDLYWSRISHGLTTPP